MKDFNYQILQWSKEVIDDILKEWNSYTDTQKKEYMIKLASFMGSILKDEATNYEILKNNS